MFTDPVQWDLLASLSPEDRRGFLAAARRRTFARHEIVFREDDPADTMHLVEQGHLAVQVTTPTGDTATLNILGPGEFFGELALLDDGGAAHRSATVRALEAATTLAVPTAAFNLLRQANPGVEHLIGVLLARRVDELSQRLVEALYVGVDRRVQLRLLDLAERYGDVADRIVIPISQDDLAGLVGAARATVNQVLQRLVARGVLALRRREIVIQSPTELRRLALR